MSNAIYKKDLHDVALAVAQGSKNYTDNSIEKLKWELGTYDLSITTDSTVEYTKTIPTNAIKGRLNYIGGASKVSENLIVLDDLVETTTNGVTYSVSNGILKINGTATASFGIYINTNKILVGTYTIGAFNDKVAGGSFGIYLRNSSTSTNVPLTLLRTVNSSYTITTTFECNQIHLWLNTNTSFDNVTIKPMLVSGTTAPTEFSVGFEGIRSAKTTSVKFDGANLINVDNKSEITDRGITYSSTNGVIKLKGTPTQGFNISWTSSKVDLPKGTYKMALFYSGSYTGIIGNYLKTTGGVIVLDGNTLTNPTTNLTLTEDKNNIYFDLYIGSNVVITQEITITPMLVRGTDTPTEFKPYEAPTTKAIPSQVQALDGYGLGIDDTCYNYIDLINKKFVQKGHKRVVDENTGYTYISSTYRGATIRTTAPYKAPTTLFKCIWYGNDNISSINYESGGHLYITFTNAYASDTELKNAMLGVIIVYELATPVEIDISQYIDDDFKNIDTTNMTTATFENEFGYDVPSEMLSYARQP